MKVVSKAEFIGYKKDKNGKNVWQGSCPAVIEFNSVRFFSVSPKDKEDANRINNAISDLPAPTPWVKDDLEFTP